MSAAVIGGGDGAAAPGVAGADAGSGRPCSASRHMCSATLNSPCGHTGVLISEPRICRLRGEATVLLLLLLLLCRRRTEAGRLEWTTPDRRVIRTKIGPAPLGSDTLGTGFGQGGVQTGETIAL